MINQRQRQRWGRFFSAVVYRQSIEILSGLLEKLPSQQAQKKPVERNEVLLVQGRQTWDLRKQRRHQDIQAVKIRNTGPQPAELFKLLEKVVRKQAVEYPSESVEQIVPDETVLSEPYEASPQLAKKIMPDDATHLTIQLVRQTNEMIASLAKRHTALETSVGNLRSDVRSIRQILSTLEQSRAENVAASLKDDNRLDSLDIQLQRLRSPNITVAYWSDF